MATAIVEEGPSGRYVDCDGIRYESEDLPAPGTDVYVEASTWIGDVPGADISWAADTPTGQSFALVRGWHL